MRARPPHEPTWPPCCVCRCWCTQVLSVVDKEMVFGDDPAVNEFQL
jgi:hypothetical protein